MVNTNLPSRSRKALNVGYAVASIGMAIFIGAGCVEVAGPLCSMYTNCHAPGAGQIAPDNPPPDTFFAVQNGIVTVSPAACAVAPLATPQILPEAMGTIGAVHFGTGNLFVYVADEVLDAIDVVDAANPGVLVAAIATGLPATPAKIVASPASQYVYVFAPGSNAVLQIDTATQTLSHTFTINPAANQYTDMTVVSFGRPDEIWIAQSNPPALIVLSSTNGTASTTPLSFTPLALAVIDTTVYVAGSDNIAHALATFSRIEDPALSVGDVSAGSILVPDLFGFRLDSIDGTRLTADRFETITPTPETGFVSPMVDTGESYTRPTGLAFSNDIRTQSTVIVTDSNGVHCPTIGKGSLGSRARSPVSAVSSPTSYTPATSAVTLTTSPPGLTLQLDTGLASQAQVYSNVTLNRGSAHILSGPLQSHGSQACSLAPFSFTVPNNPAVTVTATFVCN